MTAGDVLSLAELAELRRTSNLRGALLVLHAWAVIAGALWLAAAWPSALTAALAALVIGSRQLGLLVLMHEASHWLLFPGHRADNLVGRWLCAYPLGQDLPAYRRAHHLHHRHTLGPDDPDLDVAAAYPVTPALLSRGALFDLCGWTAAAAALRARLWREPIGSSWRRLRGPLAAHLALFGVLAAAGHWYLYPLCWLLPLATWLRLLARLRGIAEHAMVPDGGDPLRNSRSIAAGLLARAFLAPYWVNYHLEHHLLVFVPCWKLRRAHDLLLAKGYGTRMERAGGYWELIRRAGAGHHTPDVHRTGGDMAHRLACAGLAVLALALSACSSSKPLKLSSRQLCENAGGKYVQGFCQPGSPKSAAEMCLGYGGFFAVDEDLCHIGR